MLLLYAQVKDDSYTGHCVVIDAMSPYHGAGELIVRLKKEGAERACRGAVNHNVWETGDREGLLWVWVARRDAEEGRFKDCLDTGVGAYYRNGKETP